MTDKEQLEFLEALEEIPQIPDTLPLHMIDVDDTTIIPDLVLEYLRKCGAEIELDDNGRYSGTEYLRLLDKYDIELPVKPMRFVLATPESVAKMKNRTL